MTTNKSPDGTTKVPHPLVVDAETKLFRYATHDDIRRWERMEIRYTNLLATLREAISNGAE